MKKIKEYNFLTEFMSILMEFLFMDYYSGINKKESDYLINNDSFIWFDSIFRIARAQLSVLEKYDDACDNFNINEKYRKEIDDAVESGIEEKYNLYIQFYAINALCALTYYYQVKYGLPFDEVEKFYINNNGNGSLSNIINNIDLKAYEQYLIDFMPRDNKVRKKK